MIVKCRISSPQSVINYAEFKGYSKKISYSNGKMFNNGLVDSRLKWQLDFNNWL